MIGRMSVDVASHRLLALGEHVYVISMNVRPLPSPVISTERNVEKARAMIGVM